MQVSLTPAIKTKPLLAPEIEDGELFLTLNNNVCLKYTIDEQTEVIQLQDSDGKMRVLKMVNGRNYVVATRLGFLEFSSN